MFLKKSFPGWASGRRRRPFRKDPAGSGKVRRVIDMSHSVTVKDVVKYYGDFLAADHLNLEIREGEFFTLLGPSGCGKTTLLRMIAGFNSIEGGEIFFDDKVINNMAAHKRDIGMVFQNYAIFPHLTVYDNVAYGLKARNVKSSEIRKRVEEALELVQIANLKDRKPNELSGGQQQRVALARAFVIEPTVLLMDEPLSNLDAKLRVQMRTVIKKLQRRLGITTIYVTHDQEEALSISDRIAVMKEGKIMQVGSPTEIYIKPADAFVSNFIGVSNFLECEVCDGNTVRVNDYAFTLNRNIRYRGKATLSIRPEFLYVAENKAEGLKGEVQLSTFLGDFVQHEVKLDSGDVIQINDYTKDGGKVRETGEQISVFVNPEYAMLFDRETGEAIV